MLLLRISIPKQFQLFILGESTLLRLSQLLSSLFLFTWTGEGWEGMAAMGLVEILHAPSGSLSLATAP